MQLQQEYEVLRFIEQNGVCHVSMDYVTGELLADYILKKKRIEKEEFFSWMLQLIKEMEKLERTKGAKIGYQLSPFYIVLKKNATIALLNVSAKVNQKTLEALAQKKIISKFFLEDGTCDHIYSFAKTMQYILANVQLVPKLKKTEEHCLQKIISKCLKLKSKKRYQSFYEIEYKIPKIETQSKKKRILPIIIISLVVLGGAGICWKSIAIGAGEMQQCYLEMGITYLGVLEKYEKSIELFKKVEKSGVGQCYLQIAQYMNGTSSLSVSRVEEILEELQEQKGEEISLEEKYCLLKVYDSVNTKTARKRAIVLAKDLLEKAPVWLDEAQVKELLANLYQKEGRDEDAIYMYEELIQNNQEESRFLTMIALCEKCGWYDKGIELCETGLEKHGQSLELSLNYIRFVCDKAEMSAEEKSKRLQSVIIGNETLKQDERFLKLQREHGIQTEGDEVWVEE